MNQPKSTLSFLLAVAASLAVSSAESSRPIAGSGYYPLAQGNSWKYKVHKASGDNDRTVEWRVTKAEQTKTGIVYQVWPTPSDSDDEAMRLRVSSVGIEETSSNALILKFPLAVGETWTLMGPARRAFKILSLGRPCRVESLSSSDCLTVEDQDDSVRFRTVTTYAKDIGPIRYDYYLNNTRSGQPIQTLELLSYHLARR